MNSPLASRSKSGHVHLVTRHRTHRNVGLTGKTTPFRHLSLFVQSSQFNDVRSTQQWSWSRPRTASMSSGWNRWCRSRKTVKPSASSRSSVVISAPSLREAARQPSPANTRACHLSSAIVFTSLRFRQRRQLVQRNEGWNRFTDAGSSSVPFPCLNQLLEQSFRRPGPFDQQLPAHPENPAPDGVRGHGQQGLALDGDGRSKFTVCVRPSVPVLGTS